MNDKTMQVNQGMNRRDAEAEFFRLRGQVAAALSSINRIMPPSDRVNKLAETDGLPSDLSALYGLFTANPAIANLVHESMRQFSQGFLNMARKTKSIEPLVMMSDYISYGPSDICELNQTFKDTAKTPADVERFFMGFLSNSFSQSSRGIKPDEFQMESYSNLIIGMYSNLDDEDANYCMDVILQGYRKKDPYDTGPWFCVNTIQTLSGGDRPTCVSNQIEQDILTSACINYLDRRINSGADYIASLDTNIAEDLACCVFSNNFSETTKDTLANCISRSVSPDQMTFISLKTKRIFSLDQFGLDDISSMYRNILNDNNEQKRADILEPVEISSLIAYSILFQDLFPGVSFSLSDVDDVTAKRVSNILTWAILSESDFICSKAGNPESIQKYSRFYGEVFDLVNPAITRDVSRMLKSINGAALLKHSEVIKRHIIESDFTL